MSKFDFVYLCAMLNELPLAIPDCPSLDLRHYVPSTAGMEATETVNGAVNFDLERILGHKIDGLKLTEAGPGVVAIADVLEHYIKLFPYNEVLQFWPPAVMEAAQRVYKTAGRAAPDPRQIGILRLKRPAPGSDSEDKDPEPAPEPRRRKKQKLALKTTSVRTWIDLP